MKIKALRVAAYFLIGHYLIVTGLALLGKGTPDFVRMAVTLGLLIASVGSLFIPRRLGWVVVVAYAWYALTPFFLGTWAVVFAPNLASTAKIAASIVLVLINSPLLVALALVFKPASFASFRNPLPGDDVLHHVGKGPKPDATGAHLDKTGAGKPAGISGGRTHALEWAVAFTVVAVAVILAIYAYRSPPGSQWMTSAQYQREFEMRVQKGLYPHEVEGDCQGGSEKFRADWKAIPSGATFFAYHGMTRQDYERRNQEYPAQGYALVSTKQFKDCSGIQRYQATWLKR